MRGERAAWHRTTYNTWYGANLTLGDALSDLFALAVRGRYTADVKGNFIAANWGAPLLCGVLLASCRAGWSTLHSRLR